MASKAQADYIRDLAIIKLKEFKEFRELLIANDITTGDSSLNATNLSESINALTDLQASRVIDILAQKAPPNRETGYSDKRIKKATELLDSIAQDIEGWIFR